MNYLDGKMIPAQPRRTAAWKSWQHSLSKAKDDAAANADIVLAVVHAVVDVRRKCSSSAARMVKCPPR